MHLTDISRRAAMRGALQTALALAIVPSAKSAPTEPRKTSLVIAIPIEPPTLDPTVTAAASAGMVTWSNVFEGLVTIDHRGKIQPQLATDWIISPNGLTYTFKLRNNVTFHDGTPLDASVVKFSLERARSADSQNPQKRFFAQIDRIEAKDSSTLVIHLKRRNRSLLYRLGWPASVIVAPGSIETNASRPIGTGPFRFVSWNKGESIALESNPSYWNRSTIGLKSVTFRIMKDLDALAAALKSQEVDAVPEFNRPSLIADLQNEPALTTVIGVTEMKVVAAMNNARKPFNDLRVRQAMMMAVDRSALIEGAWEGLGTPIGSHYSPTAPGYRELTDIYLYDTAEAKRLLAEAGYPNGFTITMKVPQMAYAIRCSEILQAAFAEIGVKVTMEPILFPHPWMKDVFEQSDYDMTIMAHAEPMDIDIYARPNSYFNYKNQAFNDIIEDIENAASEAEQNDLYARAQIMLAKDVPALFLFTLPKIGIWNTKLRGMWENEPIPSIALSGVHWDA